MKQTLINLGIALAICSATNISAQTMSITRTPPISEISKNNTGEMHSIRVSNGTALRMQEDENYKVKSADICYDPAYLTAISDTMFRQGNPKYIWVDLLRDGYVLDADMCWYNLYINIYSKEDGGNMDIPQDIRNAYAAKWISFVQSLHEPLSKYGSYNLSNLDPISALEMVNPQSEFRKISKSELHRLKLTTNGELRFLKELVSDGLAPADKALDLEFSQNGFYVHSKRLTREQREKYMNICQEEFGYNCYNDKSRRSIGALPENTLGKEIAELTASIEAAASTNQTK